MIENSTPTRDLHFDDRPGSRMSKAQTLVLVLAALLLGLLVYLPGLGGAYEFDDFPNIVDNTALHVTTLDPTAWKQAIWSSPSSDLERPLASLSFAVNYYFSGIDPLPMKLTNLAIHLLNGWLLFLLVRRLAAVVGDDRAGSRGDWIAVIVTALWLAHPINLTAVLYVVQRMESLAQTFVLLGLLAYVRARCDEGPDTRRLDRALLWLAVPACLLLGIATKESAALLPVYALLIECTVLRFRRASKIELGAFYAVFLVVPALVGLVWILPKVLAPHAYSGRAFTLAQRLLTEPRVLLDYVAWILLPVPKFFSFFRDDYPFSIDAWHPWTTLPALIGVVAMIGAAWWIRARRPLVALGVLWFFAAQLLTATVIPLEIAFEHRNYCASAGLLLALVDLALPASASRTTATFARRAGLLALLALGAFTLVLRAREWSDPVRLAVTEAASHPESPRAAYELGRTFVVLSDYRPESPNVDKAMDAFEKAARLPRSSILPEVGLITVASRTGRPIEAAWWNSMIDKLQRDRPTVADDAGVRSLTDCQRAGRCVLDDAHTLDVYLAGLQHAPPSAAFLNSYAIFAYNRLHDSDLALRLVRGSVAASKDLQYRVNLINFLIDLGRIDDARTELATLRTMAHLGMRDADIAKLQQRLDAAQPDAKS